MFIFMRREGDEFEIDGTSDDREEDSK